MMTEAHIQTEVSAHRDRNRPLVQYFRELGVELTEIRAVDLHFFAPSRRKAETLLSIIRDLGYDDVAIDKPPLFPFQRHSVTVCANLSVNQVIDPEHVERLVRAAAQAGAVHDGWGMAVTTGD